MRDAKEEALIRVLEKRGRRGFLFLRSAEGALLHNIRAHPAVVVPTTEEKPK